MERAHTRFILSTILARISFCAVVRLRDLLPISKLPSVCEME
jgi:hypothetical protein